MDVDEQPVRCPRCWSLFGPRRVLVGWDNLHDPPCRSWTCRCCGHTVHAMDDR